jgi:alginate O-acetyltransferase complex protein AlgI
VLFNSFVFLVFGSLFFAVWPLAKRHQNGRWMFLIGASLLFYGWWDWRFIILILASGVLDYVAALLMVRVPDRRRYFLALSVLGNVGSLAVFKYLAFATTNLNGLFSLFTEAQLPVYHLILPVGISFYTFQSMSYTIDVYRGELKPTRNFLHFFSYLCMFPQLVAGPIIRARDLLPQLERAHSPTREQQWEGLRFVVHGYFKKVVLADNLAPLVGAAFGSSVYVDSSAYWWIVVIMFAFQIYFDFSGYSDIAIGLARWMGYDFARNFDHPYISTSIREFWTRWHISLSEWFRDYVYIPLGGSRGSTLRSHINMWVTMLISGLWHGASWNFVIWGGLHAFYLSVERVTAWPKRVMATLGAMGTIACATLVTVQVLVAWVFFRAETPGKAFEILRIMFSFNSFDISQIKLFPNSRIIVACLVLGCLREAYLFGREKLDLPAPVESRRLEAILLIAGIMLCVFFRGPGSAFIYFQF